MKYVVTNYGGGKNYTPSLFDDRRKAYEWFAILSLDNMANAGQLPFDEAEKLIKKLPLMSVEEIMEIEAFKELPAVSCGHVTGYDDGENVIQIFEI